MSEVSLKVAGRAAGAPVFERLALLASPTDTATQAERTLRADRTFVSLEEADAVVVLGGDGFMLNALHAILDTGRTIPAFGLNLGTVGFLMNRYRGGVDRLADQLRKAKPIAVAPLRMEAVTQSGRRVVSCAINEVSLLRETRQTAKLEVSVGGKVRIPELACDGVLLATPVGSTAYNLSAHGPILPLDSRMLALTPISPFRPRRWRGAILPEHSRVCFRVLDPAKRPGRRGRRPEGISRYRRGSHRHRPRAGTGAAVRSRSLARRTDRRRAVRRLTF